MVGIGRELKIINCHFEVGRGMIEGMTKQQMINEIVGAIVAGYRPEKVIVFGSAARGDLDLANDLDLLVIKQGVGRLKQNERYYEISETVPHRQLAIDVLVYTPREIKKRLYLGDPFIKQVLEEGKVVYGS